MKDTLHLCLKYYKEHDTGLIGYSDADWTRDITDRKITSGCVIYHCGNPISWYSRKQSCVSQSTAQAEYIAYMSTSIACATAAMNAIYFQRILEDLHCDTLVPLVYVDNQSAINMCECYKNSKRTCHVDIKYHFIKDIISKNLIKLEYIKTQDNIADVFTKSLNSIKFAKFFKELNII